VKNESTNNDKLLDEAELWIVRLRSDTAATSDKEAFSAWLNRSDDHLRAFDQAYAVWETLGAASYLPEIDESKTLVQRLKVASEPLAQLLSAPWIGNLRPWHGIVALTCLFTVFSLMFSVQKPQQHYTATRFDSQIGEVLFIELADGSSVELNTSSTIEVVYSQNQRQVKLLRGEAYFFVTKDQNRPFIVDFGKGSATAVGTSFNIYRQNGTTSVTVAEGIVDLKESADLAVPNPEPIRITANQHVTIGRRGVGPIRHLNTQRVLAWREKTIIFKNTPLADALEQLNRYLVTPAYAENLNDLKVSGTFSLNSPSETLDALVAAFSLNKSYSDTDNILYLKAE